MNNLYINIIRNGQVFQHSYIQTKKQSKINATVLVSQHFLLFFFPPPISLSVSFPHFLSLIYTLTTSSTIEKLFNLHFPNGYLFLNRSLSPMESRIIPRGGVLKKADVKQRRFPGGPIKRLLLATQFVTWQCQSLP